MRFVFFQACWLLLIHCTITDQLLQEQMGCYEAEKSTAPSYEEERRRRLKISLGGNPSKQKEWDRPGPDFQPADLKSMFSKNRDVINFHGLHKINGSIKHIFINMLNITDFLFPRQPVEVFTRNIVDTGRSKLGAKQFCIRSFYRCYSSSHRNITTYIYKYSLDI